MRVLRISLAYLAAAAVGPSVLLLAIWVAEGFGDLAGSLLFVSLGFAFAAVFAAPVALPVIVISELRGISGWWFFVVTGALAGLLIVLLTSEFPLGSEELADAILLVGAAVIAALTYWWLAGRTAKRPGDAQTAEDRA